MFAGRRLVLWVLAALLGLSLVRIPAAGASRRVTNAEVAIVARGSLEGHLEPNG